MNKLKQLNLIKSLYKKNTNIIQYLKTINPDGQIAPEDIMLSYDIQAGSYTKFYKDNTSLKNNYCLHLANIIDKFLPFNSILEIGVGEATTMAPLLKQLSHKPKLAYGFDLSWSRVKYAKAFLDENDICNAFLFVGDLFETPFMNNSIDIVYTSHSIESNGGREEEALTELYRITKKYLILLEPALDLADQEARIRIKQNGYVKNIYKTALKLGYEVIEHRLFAISVNPLNPTGLTIIKKSNLKKHTVERPLCCPLTRTPLTLINNTYFSKQSMLAYPIISEIPCLLSNQAVVATKLME